MSSISFHDKQHILRLFNQQGQIKNIFDDFARKAGIILSSYTDNEESNVWIRNKVLENRIDDLLNNLHEDLINNIDSNTQAAWSDSDAKNDDIVKLFIQDLSIADIVGKSAAESIEKGMFTRNMEAMKAFQQRRINGLSVSDRIWKVTESAKENLEYMLESGISTGRPAASISRDIRQLLQDPDKRFRRIRDEKGNLVMSQPMKAYNPGPGKYRSSYKNALRIAATETNMAYRQADFDRWQKLDFVVGIKVSRSKNNNGPCAVCDPMVGVYPKDYCFLGNHPWCKCVCVPLMLDGDEFIDYLMTKKVPEDKIVKEIPGKAKEYMMNSKNMKDSYTYKVNKDFFESTNSRFSNNKQFVQRKTIEEANAYAMKLGFKKVDFGNANIEQANVILEALHSEVASSGKNISIDRFLISDTIKGEKKGIVAARYHQKTDFKESMLEVNLKNFSMNTYRELVPFEKQISNIESKISSSERAIEAYKSKIGINKTSDKMLKNEIAKEKSTIDDYNYSISRIKISIKKGETPLPTTVSDLFEKTNDQVKAIIHHEYGHHVDYMTGRKEFKDFIHVSKYGATSRGESFAEWYSRYKMLGENDIPSELLNIFKEWEKMN